MGASTAKLQVVSQLPVLGVPVCADAVVEAGRKRVAVAWNEHSEALCRSDRRKAIQNLYRFVLSAFAYGIGGIAFTPRIVRSILGIESRLLRKVKHIKREGIE